MKPVLAICAYLLLLSQGSEASIVSAIEAEVTKLSQELISRLLVSTAGLDSVMKEVRDTKEQHPYLFGIDLDACGDMSSKVTQGEELVANATSHAFQLAGQFHDAINQLLKCASTNFIEMGKCIMAKMQDLRQLEIKAKQDIAEYEQLFKQIGRDIKYDFLVCIGKKARTTTPAPTTAAPITTSEPSTAGPITTSGPSTAGPITTSGPSTAGPITTPGPSTAGPITTSGPSTAGPITTSGPSTAGPITTPGPSTAAPMTTSGPSTAGPITTPAPSTGPKTEPPASVPPKPAH